MTIQRKNIKGYAMYMVWDGDVELCAFASYFDAVDFCAFLESLDKVEL